MRAASAAFVRPHELWADLHSQELFMSRPRRPVCLSPVTHSAHLLIRLQPSAVGMFRFLLEAWDNLAGFTVLDRKEALIKVFFSPHQEAHVRRALAAVHTEVSLEFVGNAMPVAPGARSVQQPYTGHGQRGSEQSGAADVTEQGVQPD